MPKNKKRFDDPNKRFHAQFTGESAIFPEVIDSLRYIVIPVNLPPQHFKKEMEKKYPGLHQRLRGWGLSTNDIFTLVRERLKCLAEHNLNHIPAEEVDTLRNKILPTRTRLLRLATDRNVSPVDLGYLLGGREYVDSLLQSIAEPTLPSEPPQFLPFAERSQRKGWARATVDAKDDDYLSGYRCRCRSIDAGEHLVNVVGREGETDVLNRFRSLGLDFQTERELQALGRSCTPDALMRTPIRFGETESATDVFWVDVKTRVLIPGLSAPSDVMKVVRQILRYTAEYGSGCIVWAKNRLFDKAGWDDLLRKKMSETNMQCRVFHVGAPVPKTNLNINRRGAIANDNRKGVIANDNRPVAPESIKSIQDFIQVLLFEHLHNDTELFNVLGEKYIRELSNCWANEFSRSNDPLTPSELLLLLSDQNETRFRTIQTLYRTNDATNDAKTGPSPNCSSAKGSSAKGSSDLFSFRFGRPEPEPLFDPNDFS